MKAEWYYKKWATKIYGGTIAFGVSIGYRMVTDGEINWYPKKACKSVEEVYSYIAENEWILSYTEVEDKNFMLYEKCE